ncbi:calcium-binding protein [Shimia thalassica]|uniref:calcium-binding protein n=1 Tax=Shimia thalassica TaxID=1715693 RepID=UPI0027365FA5|nr:calcium-binding protein [Shimia thalassica]MDP2519828.1 calcium-binding protein [Shimia thalassica]
MKLIRKLAFVALGALALSQPAKAEDDIKLYVFGNSLVHHQSETEETAVPYWLAQFANAGGKTFAVDGEWGFLRDFAAAGRPKAQWSFNGAPRAWTRNIRNFADVGYNVVMVNPANFIQYKSPDAPFDGENAARETPLTATAAISAKADAPRFVIYEGWADMSAFVRSFPPRARQLRRFHEFNQGEYHQWYEDYHALVQTALPEKDVDLIPVARILSKMFQTGPLKDIPVEALYVDDAPHGTPTLYFLAAAITYVGLYEDALPSDMNLPDTLHPDLRANYDAVRAFIHAEMGQKQTTTPSAVAPKKIAVAKPAPNAGTPAPGLGLENPSLGMGASVVADWSTQNAFIDLMKSARPWIGHVPGQWGGMSAEDLDFGGFFDEEGWIWGIPPKIEAVETFILTDQPEQSSSLTGRYRLTYDGTGEVSLTGRARVQSRENGEIWFEYRPGDGVVGIRIDQTDPMRTGDYINNIHVLREDHIALHEAGLIFNPDWLDKVGDLRVLRFMDWMQTNDSRVSEWGERPLVSDFSYAWRGVPVEVMVALGNRIGADIWVTLPHQATNNYAAEFARMVKRDLHPDRKVFVEYSNELWNFTFEQANWAREKAVERWGEKAGDDAWMQYAGMRAAEIARIWEWEFGSEAKDRLVRVVAVHTGWKGLEQVQLEAPLWLEEARGNPAPITAFDAYAVSGYFGLELGSDEGAEKTLGWINTSMQSALKDAMGQGLKRAAMQDYVRDHLFDAAIPLAAEALRNGSLSLLTKDLLPYHARVAKENGLALAMYEGGTHVTGIGEWADDEAMTNLFIQLNYSPEMAALYQELLTAWRNTEGSMFFNAYSDVSNPSKWGSWGSLRHLDDTNPRFDALSAANQQPPQWDNAREQGTFLHGGIFEGTDGPDRLAGTVKHDVLLGNAGDDVLVAAGLADNLHGGAGYDIAELPGNQADYVIRKIGERTFIVSDNRRFVLAQIEAVKFAGAQDSLLELAQLQ